MPLTPTRAVVLVPADAPMARRLWKPAWWATTSVDSGGGYGLGGQVVARRGASSVGLAMGLDGAAIESFVQQCTAVGFDCPPIKINP